jgi:hypothetical protein
VIVSGVARSGTSLVAGALHHLGVFMGAAGPPVYEDVKLSRDLEMEAFEKARNRISSYNDEHAVWGWKRPSAVNYLDTVDQIFPNPFYIFVFKDLFSIANRNRISMNADLITNMQQVYHQLGGIIDFIRKAKPLAMLVAYDKVLLEREMFIQTVCEFVGLEPSEEQIQAAMDFIRPNPSDYLDLARNTKAKGFLGKVEEKRVIGWARAVYNEMPIKVELFVNDQKIADTTANLFRDDLKKKKIHPTGRIGFRFDLRDEQKLKKGDVVRVRAENEVNDLIFSPKMFEG